MDFTQIYKNLKNLKNSKNYSNSGDFLINIVDNKVILRDSQTLSITNTILSTDFIKTASFSDNNFIQITNKQQNIVSVYFKSISKITLKDDLILIDFCVFINNFLLVFNLLRITIINIINNKVEYIQYGFY